MEPIINIVRRFSDQKIAIIGERSIIPMRGMIERIDSKRRRVINEFARAGGRALLGVG